MSKENAFTQHPDHYRPPHLVELQEMATELCPWFAPWYVRQDKNFPNFCDIVSVGPYGESHVLTSLWDLAMFFHWCRVKESTTTWEPPPEPYAPQGRYLITRAKPG
jgi:hypothetical protein